MSISAQENIVLRIEYRSVFLFLGHLLCLLTRSRDDTWTTFNRSNLESSVLASEIASILWKNQQAAWGEIIAKMGSNLELAHDGQTFPKAYMVSSNEIFPSDLSTCSLLSHY